MILSVPWDSSTKVTEATVNLDNRRATIVGHRPDGFRVEETFLLNDLQMGHLGKVKVKYRDGGDAGQLEPQCVASLSVSHFAWRSLAVGGLLLVAGIGFQLWRRRRRTATTQQGSRLVTGKPSRTSR